VEEVREYAICQLDVQGRVASWNLGAERILGWPAEEILGQPNSVFYPAEEVRTGKPVQDMDQARTTGSLHQEAWRIRKDGSRFFASEVLTATHDTEGQVTGSTKITHDITDRREMEEHIRTMARDLEAQMASRTAELQESEARLQGFIQHAPAAIAFKDLKGHLLMVNRRAEALIGKSLATTPGKTMEEVFPSEVVAKVREQDERVVTQREEIQIEESVALPDTGMLDLLIQKFPLIDAIGHCWGMGVIATDVTERKQGEQANRQRQKLESLGLLAGGIAHDFNNLLGAMLGNLELARSGLDSAEQVSSRLLIVEELIARASTLVAQILAYAGKGKFQIQSLDLNRQVEEMMRFLQAALSRKASLQWETAPGLPPMEGDAGQLSQVIMNLVLNAAEAMEPQGGLVTIRTGSERLTQADIDRRFRGHALNPGPHLTLEVSDNGPGIPTEVQERIFDPFFTTKFTGRGLGLSAVQGILRSHQGGIQVVSEAGKGTTFRLFFPAVSAPAKVEVAGPQHPGTHASTFHGTGTVLVVDDEDSLRAVAASALRRMGFDTVQARDGLEALQLFEANRDRIRLILMDLTMPRMDGEEAYKQLRRAGAMAPIILSSGFGQEEALRRFRGKGLAGFLPKPYRFQTLVDVIRIALEGHAEMGGYPPRELVTWIPEFETGHPIIDTQHRGLVVAFNQLVAATGRGDGKAEAGKALAHLIDATMMHFRIEEGLMAGDGYANTKEHQGVHLHLTGQIQDLAQKISRGDAAFTPPILNFMEDWLLCHIQLEDMDLARQLMAGGH
jgi:hemerythrin-like metal-binding protein/PAS domain S-box-containing protein